MQPPAIRTAHYGAARMEISDIVAETRLDADAGEDEQEGLFSRFFRRVRPALGLPVYIVHLVFAVIDTAALAKFPESRSAMSNNTQGYEIWTPILCLCFVAYLEAAVGLFGIARRVRARRTGRYYHHSPFLGLAMFLLYVVNLAFLIWFMVEYTHVYHSDVAREEMKTTYGLLYTAGEIHKVFFWAGAGVIGAFLLIGIIACVFAKCFHKKK